MPPTICISTNDSSSTAGEMATLTLHSLSNIALGVQPQTRFKVNPCATNTDVVSLYGSTTGALSFDRDGRTNVVPVATLTGPKILSATGIAIWGA